MLNELRFLAEKLRENGDFSKAYELSEFIFKLNVIIRDKFIKLNYSERFVYFDKLRCKIHRGILPLDNEKYISVIIKLNNKKYDYWYVLVPVDVAEKVLIFGMP